MTIDNIKSLKDCVYELEGLLELAQLREDRISDLEPLIAARIRMLSEMTGTQEADTAVTPQPEAVAEPLKTTLFEDDEIIVSSEDAVERYTIEEDVTRSVAMPEAFEPSAPSATKPAFCVNDRFRFRRELFNNSDPEFAATMDLVATMDSYEEAEEYFLTDMGWDAENQDVIDFLEVIRKYFES